MAAAIEAGVQRAAAFLMGRKLYEEWSAYWSRTDQDQDFATFINNARKYVVSNTLDNADWNSTTVISGDVAAKVRDTPPYWAGPLATEELPCRHG